MSETSIPKPGRGNRNPRTPAQLEAVKNNPGRPKTGAMPIKKIALRAQTWAALEGLAKMHGVPLVEIVRSVLEKATRTQTRMEKIMKEATAATIRNEIAALNANGITDILVSITADGQAVWGEPMALERGEMEQEMAWIEFETDGMLTAEQFNNRF